MEKQPASVTSQPTPRDPEQETLLADSVGVALLVVLESSFPGRTSGVRAARRIRGPVRRDCCDPLIAGRKRCGSLPAARDAGFERRNRTRAPICLNSEQWSTPFSQLCGTGTSRGLSRCSIPTYWCAFDEAAARPGAPREIRGARNWAQGAVAFSQMVRFAEAALVDGSVGIVSAPDGKLSRVLRFTIANGKILQADIIGEPARLRELELAVL